MKKIGFICKVTMICLDLIICLWVIFSVKYFNFDFDAVRYLLVLLLLIGIVIIEMLFLKTIRLKKVVSMMSMVVVIVSLLGSLLFPVTVGAYSVTSNVNNYRKFDKLVNKSIEEQKFPFPKKIDDQKVTVQEYEYNFVELFEENSIIKLKVKYKNRDDYSKEKDRIMNNFIIVRNKSMGGKQILYTVNSASTDIFCVFDDKNLSVIYGYFSGINRQSEQYF